MYKTIYVVFILVLLSITAPLWAQDSTRYSLGMNLVDFFQKSDYDGILENDGYGSSGYPVFYASYTTLKLKIEPEFGVCFINNECTINEDPYSKSENHQMILHGGIGVFYVAINNPKGCCYLGGRIGVDRLKEDRDNQYGYGENTDASVNVWYMGPCLGIEYHFLKNISLGGEIQLLYQKYSGDMKTLMFVDASKNYNTQDISGSRFRSKPLIFLRWYF